MSSCSSSKTVVKNTNFKADKIIAKALQRGALSIWGTTKKGIECLGIVYLTYGSQNIQLPRVSRDMAKREKKPL